MDRKAQLDKLNTKQGTYVFLVQVARPLRIQVGRLGLQRFPPGIYVYIGSAMGIGATSLGHRLRRHFSNSKKKHWHIDYLLSGKVNVLGALWAETEESVECGLASALRDSRVFEAGFRGFGASDCREGCGTHLFRYAGNSDLKVVRTTLLKIFRQLDLSPLST